MEEHHLVSAIKGLCEKDPRYTMGAYFFIVEALDFTARELQRCAKEGTERHVSGQELTDGIRRYALQQFGPMSLTVLRSWGINRTEDFGELVFNLIDAGKLRRTESDRKEDFAGGYDFEEVFSKPFLPHRKPERGVKPLRTRRKSNRPPPAGPES